MFIETFEKIKIPPKNGYSYLLRQMKEDWTTGEEDKKQYAIFNTKKKITLNIQPHIYLGTVLWGHDVFVLKKTALTNTILFIYTITERSISF